VPPVLGVIRETAPGETRVALLPEHLKKALAPVKGGPPGWAGVVQAGAGERAFAFDDAYRAAGAEVVPDADAVAARCDVLLAVGPPGADLIGSMKPGGVLLGLLDPAGGGDHLQACAERGVTAIAFERLPRITRAQKADVLSSMSTAAGYRAVLRAAALCPKFFPMMMTAAGTITPSRVLVLGAGVAGLQAIATARRLGAIVEAYDVRAAAREQVLSLGARFVDLGGVSSDAETAGGYAREQSAEEQARQREALAGVIAEADVVITTALIPGKPAPRLIDAATVERMRPGAVVVDLAAPAGGNCELTEPGATVERGGVRIDGPVNLPAELPVDASRMFGQNALAFLEELRDDGAVRVDLDNDMVGPACVVHAGELRLDAARAAPSPAPTEEAPS